MILRYGTVYTRIFPMVQSADHISPLLGASPVVQIVNAGAGISFVTAVRSPAIEVGNGFYAITLTSADILAVGDIALHCTATNGDPTDICDQAIVYLFTDVQLSNGRPLIAGNIQQGASLAGSTFPMVSASTGQRLPGLTVTAQRTLGSGGFVAAASSVSEIGGTGTTGIYALNLLASDLAAPAVGLLFTAAGARDLYIPILPTP